MADQAPFRWREVLVAPLLIGVVVAAFQFGLPQLLQKGKRLSFLIEGPAVYISPQAVGSLKIQVNNISTSSLVAYKVKVWNSGDVPLRDLPVRLSFDHSASDFTVFGVLHNTVPREEFGPIKEEGDARSRRFVYDLLNPGDSDTITVLSNQDSKPDVYVKAEGLKIADDTQHSTASLSRLTPLFAGLASVLTFVITAFQRRLERRRVEQEKLNALRKAVTQAFREEHDEDGDGQRDVPLP